jgi:integrase/recombinase XerD
LTSSSPARRTLLQTLRLRDHRIEIHNDEKATHRFSQCPQSRQAGCRSSPLRSPDLITMLNKWMGTWKSRTYWSKSKKRDNTIAFFDHCIAQKWITATLDKSRGNPARGMAKIVGRKDSSIPTLPLTPAQFNAVLHACSTHDVSLAMVNKTEVRGKGKRLHALCNLMRWSGLAITDAVTLQCSRLGEDNRLMLYRTKTGNPVTVLIPPHIANELRIVPPGPDAHPDYFFWSGKGKRNKAASAWQKTLRRLKRN